jgi:hypothetical protein
MDDSALIGTDGLPLVWGSKVEEIHPEDRKTYKEIRGWHRFWRCESVTSDGYLLLTYKTYTIRVLPEKYWVFPIRPIYGIGDEVRVKIEPHIEEKATIDNIGWDPHSKCEYYRLQFGEIKSSRWYWRDDIEPYTET